jgi:hypothetical protein
MAKKDFKGQSIEPSTRLERLVCALLQNSNAYPRLTDFGVIQTAERILKELEKAEEGKEDKE